MKFVTPLVLFVVMLWWFINDAIPILLLSNAKPENVPYIWGSRILMIIIAVLLLLLVKKAWSNHSIRNQAENNLNNKITEGENL